MSKELLPEPPTHVIYFSTELGGPLESLHTGQQLRDYGQACYEAGRKSVGDLDQILHDPENQPSQFGTVPTEYLEQFRSAVWAYMELADQLLEPELRIAECNRLLAIIDGEKS